MLLDEMELFMAWNALGVQLSVATRVVDHGGKGLTRDHSLHGAQARDGGAILSVGHSLEVQPVLLEVARYVFSR